ALFFVFCERVTALARYVPSCRAAIRPTRPQLPKPVLFAVLPTVRTHRFRTSPMATETFASRKSNAAAAVPWRRLTAAVLVLVIGWGGIVYAANNSVQGAKKEDGGFDGDAPTAILVEASSGSVLFEKNADELRAPSSMMKLMTVEVVFNALKEGKVKLTDEYRISENAWRRGGAPSGGSTMFAAINSKV